MNLQKHTLMSIILAILLGPMVVACSSDETSEKASPIPEPDPIVVIDEASPNVVSNAVVPNNGGNGVLIGTSIKFAFDEPIDVSSVTTASDSTCGATVQLSSNNFASCVPLRPQIDRGNDNRSFTVYPFGNLDYNTKFELKLKKWIQDNAGNYLTNDFIPLVFTTVADNTVSLVDSVTAEFEEKLRTAAGYSTSRATRSNNKILPITSTQIDAIIEGARSELASTGRTNSEELSKILEDMMTGSLKGIAGKITTPSIRKSALSAISFNLVSILPGREKFYTDNSSVIVANILKTGVSQLSLTKVSTEEAPLAIGGIVEGLTGSLETLGFSESERANQLVPNLLENTLVTANAVYSNVDSTFWEVTNQQLGQAYVTGMSSWADWDRMETNWDAHLSRGLAEIINNLNKIDGVVTSEVEELISSAVSGIWMGWTYLEPKQISTTGEISKSIGQTVLKESRDFTIGGQSLNLASVVSGVTESTKTALAFQPQSTSESILTKLEEGIDAKNIIVIEVVSTSDNTSPVITDFSISSGASAELNVILNASDTNGAIASYFISENSNTPSLNDSSWQVYYSSSFIHSMENPTIGSKTFYAWVKDQAGNLSEPETKNIEVIDETQPEILKLTLANGATYFNRNTVNVVIDGKDAFGVKEMLITEFDQSTQPSPNDERWKPYLTSTTYAFILNPHSSKSIYAWLKDASGNVSPKTSSTVILDLDKPDNVSLEIITSDNSTTKEQTVQISLKASDNKTNDLGITAYFYSESSTTPSLSSSSWINISTIKNFSSNISYRLSSGTGEKTIYAWFKDLAGNVSTVVSDKIDNQAVPNLGDPVSFFQKNNTYSMLETKTIFDSIDNNTINFLENDGEERFSELFRAIVERIDIDFNDNASATITSVSSNKVDLEIFAEEHIRYDLDIEGNSTLISSGGLDSLTADKDNFTPAMTKTYQISFQSASVGDNISVTSYVDNISNQLVATSKKTVNLKDNFEPHVAIQHSNHNGQDSFIGGVGDNASDPNVTSKMIVIFDANPTNTASTSEKMVDFYYFPKLNLTASLYDKYGFRELADNTSKKSIGETSEDLDNVTFRAVNDQRQKNSEKTPLLAVNSPGSGISAVGTTSTGRSDRYYTSSDYDAWATTLTIPEGPACLYYSAQISDVNGSFTGNWYPSNSIGTITTGSLVIDSDSDNSTIPSSLSGYTISSTYIQNVLGGLTVQGNILKGPENCGTPAQTLSGYERSVRVNLTEPISQITSLSEFKNNLGVLGQSNVPSGDLSKNIIGITAVENKDHINITLTDWRTIDASKHFTSDNQSVVANTELEGISKESLMQIVGMSDSDNVSATAGNGRGFVFVDATPPLATSLSATDNGSAVIITILFDQPTLTGRNFTLFGFGGKDNASNGLPIFYEFIPNSTTNTNTVIRKLLSDNSTSGMKDVFSPSDNISTAIYSESISGKYLVITILDNTTNDFSNFFAALSDNHSVKLSANDNEYPSFYIDYDNITDQNYNSWNKVEYYDAYLTNGIGPDNDRSNQLGPRLVGVDYLKPKIGPSQNHDSNDNVFLMEVLDHDLQIVSAFGTGAYDGTQLTGSGLYFDTGPTVTGDTNNSTDNASTATQNDYPLYRFWNASGNNAADSSSNNNNTRTRAVISFASGITITDTNSNGKAYIRSYLDNDNTSLTTQTTTSLMIKSAALANGLTTGSTVNSGEFKVDNNAKKLIVGIPNYTFTTDGTTGDKTSVGSKDILVIDGIEVDGLEYVLHISPPNVTNADTGVTETIGSVSGDNLAIKVYRKVYLDISMDGIVADNKTSSNDLTNSRELTFNFLENLASASATYYPGSPTNMTGVDFTESAEISNSNQIKIALSNPTGTSDSSGRYVGDGAKISLTATDFSGNSNTYTFTFKLGHNQESAITNINDIGDINPVHNLIESTANSSKKALQAP